MVPALKPGDLIIAEGATYLFRDPHRGEIVAFATAGISDIRQTTVFSMRVAGIPDDHVRITRGHLFVNDVQLILRNKTGAITYTNDPRARYLSSPDETITVPPGHYFVLGDNSSASADSRFWGFVPAKNIRSRVAWCYWPPGRTGPVQ